MSREVRMVPADWQHPEGKALLKDFSKRHAEWVEGSTKWEQGFEKDYSDYPLEKWKAKDAEADISFEEHYGCEPIASDYMPEWPASEATHFMMYETCSEGSSISPAFETPQSLARWLADNDASAFGDMTATYDQWLAMIGRGSSAASMVINLNTGAAISGVAAVSESQQQGKIL